MVRKFLIVFVLLGLCPALAMAAEESSVMEGKIRASVGGLPAAPAGDSGEPAGIPADAPMTPPVVPASPQGIPNALKKSPFPMPTRPGGEQMIFSQPNTQPGIINPEAVPPTAAPDPMESEINLAVQQHVLNSSRTSGMFEVFDAQLSKNRKLNLLMVEGPSQKIGNVFRTAVKFQDVNSGEIVDLNFDVQAAGEQIIVVNMAITKINGEDRLAQNVNNNAPLFGTESNWSSGGQLPAIFANPDSINNK